MKIMPALSLLGLIMVFSLILGACSQPNRVSQEPAMEHNMEEMEAKEAAPNMDAMTSDLPADLDMATEKMSEQGDFPRFHYQQYEPARHQ